MTAVAARNDSGTVGAQGIEFWHQITEVELSRSEKNAHTHGYISLCKDNLIKLLLEGIANVPTDDPDDDEDDEWGVHMSSGCCLEKIALLLKSDVMPPVVQFVTENISSENWKARYAALIALGAITEGPEKTKFSEILVNSF